MCDRVAREGVWEILVDSSGFDEENGKRKRTKPKRHIGVGRDDRDANRWGHRAAAAGVNMEKRCI